MTKEEMDKLELRKVKALEKIAISLDSIAIWVEDIDKKDWGDRIQYYLSEWKKRLGVNDEKKT